MLNNIPQVEILILNAMENEYNQHLRWQSPHTWLEKSGKGAKSTLVAKAWGEV